MKKKRIRDISINVWVRRNEYKMIQERMTWLGTQNMSAYIRKMALNGYALNVDISPVRELVSLLRRCSNNLNQVAKHVNTYGIYEQEIKGLQKDYEKLWEQVGTILKQLSEVVAL